jgi:hypothetical protein
MAEIVITLWIILGMIFMAAVLKISLIEKNPNKITKFFLKNDFNFLIGVFFLFVFVLTSLTAMGHIIDMFFDTGEEIKMVKFITNWLTSSVTIVTLSVAIEVAALIHLIKWELIRESRQRGFSHKKANELLQHGIKVIVTFFIGIMSLFCFITSLRAFQKTSEALLEKSIETDGLGNVNFLSVALLSVFTLIFYYFKVPAAIMHFYGIRKDFKKIPIEVIFKKKLIAVCMVIAAISLPIFFTTVTKYGILF